MLGKNAGAALAFAGLIASTDPSFAMGGGLGCTELSEYYRAVGTVENGEGSCGMTMAEARRVLARGNPDDPAAAPAPRARHLKRRRHKAVE